MARHDQRPKTKPFVCEECQFGACDNCIDILRAVADLGDICKCKRPDHDGEPVRNQALDPFDGSVHGPGAVVTQDGEVKANEQFKRRFTAQFDGLGE